MIFGCVLLTGWPARDIQGWESQPIGPFLGRAYATSISPCIVTSAALEPFCVPAPKREKPLLPSPRGPGPKLHDIDPDVLMQPEGAERPTRIAHTNYREVYYSAAQQLCQHAGSGCAMNAGDLRGSGTISGPEKESCGSLLELRWAGKEPIMLDTGEIRTFIEDGDALTLTGAARRDGCTTGFGGVTGKILPAVEMDFD